VKVGDLVRCRTFKGALAIIISEATPGYYEIFLVNGISLSKIIDGRYLELINEGG